MISLGIDTHRPLRAHAAHAAHATARAAHAPSPSPARDRGAPPTRDTFERTGDPARTAAPRLLGLIHNAGHTTQILDLKAGLLERDGERDKAQELRAIKDVYAAVGRADNGRGNCCSATTATLAALRERFGADGLQHWRFDSIGVGRQADGSYAHQAVAITEAGKDRPTFVLDPTRMPWLKIPGIPGQGSTDAWDQAYTLSEFLRTREANYGPGWTLGVP